ncbi:MAG: pantoate--beta-alanine ligase [Deltaproteobacteria bacterium]|nr:pantoate--beta-alanine ligase [Deltaproteobacteria bacterium]
MRVIRSVGSMQSISRDLKKKGKTIAFVPTMGYLHEGHLRLVDVAKNCGDVVVVSIFVNPIQFGPTEDFKKYPRDIKGDLTKLRKRGTDIVFLPVSRDVYPDGFQTFVDVVEISKPLCGKYREGHFRGVATIVAKLFNIVMPDIAVFGKKDYQQYILVKRMVCDLNFPIKIIGVETVREEDGLAMSSRNSYLSAKERKLSSHFAESLYLASRLYKKGRFSNPNQIIRFVRDYLRDFSGIKVQYVDIRSADNLNPVGDFSKDMVLAAAVFIGKTRLIDNRILRARCQ